MVLWCEMRRKHRNFRSVKLASADPLQHDRVRAAQAGSADPLKRRGFRELEHLYAVLEQRREALSGVEPTRVNFPEVRKKVGFDVSISADELR